MGDCLIARRGGGESNLPQVGTKVGELIYNSDLPAAGLDVSGYAMIVTGRTPTIILFPKANLVVIASTSSGTSRDVKKLTTETYNMDGYNKYNAATKKMASSSSSSTYMFYYK